MNHRLFALLICSCLHIHAEETPSAFQLHGYVKNLETVTVVPGTKRINLDFLLHNRLNFAYASGSWHARLELRNRFFVGDQVRSYPKGQFTNLLPNDAGLAKPWWDWSNGFDQAGFSEIDRYQVCYARERFAVTLGKQRIHWGVTNYWNANDLFNAYNFLDFDYEERAGREAIRVQWFTAGNAGWEFVYAPSRKSGMQAGGVLRKFNCAEYDFQVLAAIHQRDFAAGGGWAGHLGKTGFKGEASWFLPLRVEDRTTERLVISSGLDRTFAGDWYVHAGLLFNLLGDELTATQLLTSTNLTARQLSPYRYNLLAGCTKALSPITQFGMTAWYAPKHHSLLLFPTFVWNASDNLDVDLLAQLFYQERLGEYGSGGSLVFARVRWSF